MPTDEFLKNDAFLTTELLKLAVESAGIGIWKVDPQTRKAWIYTSEGSREVCDGMLCTENPEILVPIAAVFES